MDELISFVRKKKLVTSLGLLAAGGVGFLGGFLWKRPHTDLSVRQNMNPYDTEPVELEKLRKAMLVDYPASEMVCTPEKAELTNLFIHMTEARRVVVIGFGFGYNTLRIAMSLPPGDTVVACDFTDVLWKNSLRFFKEASVEKKVNFGTDQTLIKCLDALLASGGAQSFDMVFVDVDTIIKDQLYDYYEYYGRSLELLRQGGLLVLDNMLCDGRICDPEEREAAEILRKCDDLKRKVYQDDSFTVKSSIPISNQKIIVAKKR